MQDSRALYRIRHGLTHLAFLAGGLGCYALTYRLYGRRPLALGAMGLFLLHPRLCAHAFFNSKDIPFLSLFMLALLLIHWAGRRGSVAAFLLCGLGVGALTNLRPMGILLFGAVLALRAGDAVYAERGARRAILRTSGAFVLACALTIYALQPYLWADPIRRFVEIVAHGVQRPDDFPLLLRGRHIQSSELPLAYAPVWFAIATPLLALSLGLLGSAEVLRCLWRQRGATVRCARSRFTLLLLACFVLPVLAVMLLKAVITTIGGICISSTRPSACWRRTACTRWPRPCAVAADRRGLGLGLRGGAARPAGCAASQSEHLFQLPGGSGRAARELPRSPCLTLPRGTASASCWRGIRIGPCVSMLIGPPAS